MKKVRKRPVKARRRWVVNPRTRIKESEKTYSRPKEKRKVVKNYEGYSKT